MHSRDSLPIDRRTLLAGSASMLAAGLLPGRASAQQFSAAADVAAWSPDYVRKIAGTVEVDTAAECNKIVPLSHKGRITYWYVGPNDASPRIEHEIDADTRAGDAGPAEQRVRRRDDAILPVHFSTSG